MELIIREATEVELHPDDMDREEDLPLGRSWKPFIPTLNKCRKALSRHKRLLVPFRAHQSIFTRSRISYFFLVFPSSPPCSPCALTKHHAMKLYWGVEI
jgi:hypothetical protein